MRMDEGLDTGPILAQSTVPIGDTDTTASLSARLADLAALLMVEVLPRWLAGEIEAQPQDGARATYCGHLTKEDGRLDWTRPAAHLDRQIRACDPWPGAYTTWAGQGLKVLRARPLPKWQGDGAPGQVVALEPEIGVVTGQGALALLEVQRAGKKPMEAGLFARGQRDLLGSLLGT
jgi:methionyl-tRNA formyltransferase